MDIILFSIGLLFVLLGIAGSILPVLPGPPLSWVGLLLLYLTKAVPNNWWILAITLLIAVVIAVLDYVIPLYGTKKFGGTKYGMWGSTIGLFVGIIFTPIGMILGSMLGALIGELYYDIKDTNRALKAALGSFIGFMTSTFLKVVVAIGFLMIFAKITWQYKEQIF